MTLGRQITAVVLLFAWCFATGHLWTAHAGERLFGGSGEEHAHDWDHHHHEHDDDHHEDEDQPAEESHHHHHAIGAATRTGAAQDLTIEAPLAAILLETLLDAFLRGDADEPQPAISGSPPDERSSGYLFVLQTAHPVRGPSLIA
jgi:hypothetical protein